MNDAAPDPCIIRFDCGQVPLLEDDYEYILGAYLQRKAVAIAEGRIYHVTDFVRDALIEAAHQPSDSPAEPPTPQP